MTDQDEESFTEWLFYTRKQRHRRRATHRTLSTTKNTQENHE